MDLSQECTHCGMILGVPVEGYCWPGWSLLKVGKCHHIFCSACAQSSTLQWAPGVPRCLQCENPYHSVVVYAGKPAGLRLRDTTINQADVHSVAYVSFKIPGSASTQPATASLTSAIPIALLAIQETRIQLGSGTHAAGSMVMAMKYTPISKGTDAEPNLLTAASNGGGGGGVVGRVDLVIERNDNGTPRKK